MLEFLRSLVLSQEAQHTQGNQGTQEDQDAQGIQENQGNQHFKTATSVWFIGYCAQFKTQAQTRLYQGVNLCQTTLLLEQLVGVLPAVNAAPSQRELVSSVVRLLQRGRPNADFMGELQRALRLNKADSAAPRLKPFTAMKRAKREPNALKLCVGYGYSKTLVLRWE